MKRLSRTFPARLSAFEQVRSLIGEFGEAAGLGREDRHKLTLIVEELFTKASAVAAPARASGWIERLSD